MLQHTYCSIHTKFTNDLHYWQLPLTVLLNITPIKKDAPIGTQVYAALEVVLLIVLIVNHYSLVTAVAGHREGHLGCCCRPWVWVSDSRCPIRTAWLP